MNARFRIFIAALIVELFYVEVDVEVDVGVEVAK